MTYLTSYYNREMLKLQERQLIIYQLAFAHNMTVPEFIKGFETWLETKPFLSYDDGLKNLIQIPAGYDLPWQTFAPEIKEVTG